MTQNPTRTGLALLAALVPLLVVALTGPLVTLVADRPLRELIVEGDWGMYAVLLFAGVGAVAAGVMMLLGAFLRFPAALAMLCAVPVWLLGVLGTDSGIVSGVVAVSHAERVDRATILLASFAEAATCWVTGAWLSGALLLGVAAALLILGAARPAPEDRGRRAAWVASAIASLALAAAAVVDALRVLAVTDVYRTGAHVSRADAPIIFEELLPRVAALDAARPLVALGAVLVGLAAIAVAARRAPGALALGAALVGLLGTAGLATLGDLRATTEKAELEEVIRTTTTDRGGLLTIPVGDRPREPIVTLQGTALQARDQRFPTDGCEGVLWALRQSPGLVLGVAPDADPEALRRVLVCAQQGQAKDVTLVGRAYAPQTLPASPPASVAAVLEVARQSLGSASFALVAAPADCAGCEAVELRDDGVHLTGGGEPVTLPLEWPPFTPYAGTKGAVLTLDHAIKPELLALTAAVLSNRPLALVVATGAAEAPESPVGPGALSKEEIRAVIKEHQGEVKLCYERRLQQVPRLDGKLAVTWTIQPDGSVREVSAEPAFDAEVASCVVGRVQRWRFPKPSGGGVVKVTYPWIFKAAD